jgi:hypothetical protein
MFLVPVQFDCGSSRLTNRNPQSNVQGFEQNGQESRVQISVDVRSSFRSHFTIAMQAPALNISHGGGPGKISPRPLEPDVSDSPLMVKSMDSKRGVGIGHSRPPSGRKSSLSLNTSHASDTDSFDESINPDPDFQIEEANKQLRGFLQRVGLERHTDQLMNTFSIQAPSDIIKISACMSSCPASCCMWFLTLDVGESEGRANERRAFPVISDIYPDHGTTKTAATREATSAYSNSRSLTYRDSLLHMG